MRYFQRLPSTHHPPPSLSPSSSSSSQCAGGVCALLQNQGFGQLCGATSDCAAGLTCAIFGGLSDMRCCQVEVVPADPVEGLEAACGQLPLGSTCLDSTQCASNLYCSAGFCVPESGSGGAAGAGCTSDDSCDGSLRCGQFGGPDDLRCCAQIIEGTSQCANLALDDACSAPEQCQGDLVCQIGYCDIPRIERAFPVPQEGEETQKKRERIKK